MVMPISDKSMETIEWAMKALNARSEVTSQNIANAQTPGYRASRVSFENMLGEAVNRGRVGELDSPLIELRGGQPDINGNDVRIEDEVVDMIQTNLLAQSMFQAFTFKANVLRSAIRGQ